MQAALVNWVNHAFLLAVHLMAIYTKPMLVLRYVRRTKNLPFFSVPRTLNDKYLWRKIFDHNPTFTVVSDKLACKDYIRKYSLDLKVAGVVKILDHPEDILQLSDAFLLQPWVLKSSHGSGDTLVMPNGCLDRAMLVQRAKHMLAREHARAHHEWGYFNVPKKVFFEEYIQTHGELCELKIYTFGQHVGRIVHIGGRFKGMWAQAWEIGPNGQFLLSSEPATLAPPKANQPLPNMTLKMIHMAQHLGKDFDHMRVDLLFDGQNIWFGELTVYNLAGYHLAPSGYLVNSGMTLFWNLKNAHSIRTQHTNLIENCYFNILKSQLLKEESIQ